MSDSRELIRKTFVKIYSEKSFEKMNIKELCMETPVARSTFYEHYENLGEVKAEIEDQLIGGILEIAGSMSNGKTGNVDLKDYFEAVLNYIKSNWDVNYAFLVKHPNLSYIEKWKDAIKYHFMLQFPEKTNIPNYNLISEVIACAVIGAYTYWMKHPDEMDAAKINEITIKAMGLLPEII